MPPVGAALAAVGGGSALAGGMALATGAAGIYGGKRDRDSVKNANNRAVAEREASQRYIEKSKKEARSDIFRLFPPAQESTQKGIQSSMDFLGKGLPLQMQSFQQGNNQAQQTLAEGLGQFQNAILGNPVQAPQPQSINTQGIQGLINAAQLPEFQFINSAMGGNTVPQQNINRGHNPDIPMIDPYGIGSYKSWYDGRSRR